MIRINPRGVPDHVVPTAENGGCARLSAEGPSKLRPGLVAGQEVFVEDENGSSRPTMRGRVTVPGAPGRVASDLTRRGVNC